MNDLNDDYKNSQSQIIYPKTTINMQEEGRLRSMEVDRRIERSRRYSFDKIDGGMRRSKAHKIQKPRINNKSVNRRLNHRFTFKNG